MIAEFAIFNASVLIVDDRATNVQLLEQVLRDAGYTNITTTMDPTTVCALHKSQAYDLILLDLNMPVMDGFQVMEQLKAAGTDPYLPVIVLTAEPRHKLQALQAGAKDFISKPFDLLEVKTRIYNMLEVRLLYKKMENYSKLLEMAMQQDSADAALVDNARLDAAAQTAGR
ncbi:MAG: response regulator [Pseudomonadota bacterium]